MGKPYGHDYSFAPSRNSAGTMICAKCNQPILSELQDWMHYTKTSKGDWAYVCFHRECCDDQSGWEKLEKAKVARNAIHSNRMNKLREVASYLGINDSMEFARLASESLGDDDLDGTYFSMYGSS